MIKKVLILIGLIIFLSTSAFADETFSIPCLDEITKTAAEFITASNDNVNLHIKLVIEDQGLQELPVGPFMSWLVSDEVDSGVYETLTMVLHSNGECKLER